LIPPKISLSGYVGTIKGRTAIRVLNNFRKLKERPYWGNHFWARGYCVDTVGLAEEMIRKYHERGQPNLAPSGGKADYPLLGVNPKPGPLDPDV